MPNCAFSIDGLSVTLLVPGQLLTAPTNVLWLMIDPCSLVHDKQDSLVQEHKLEQRARFWIPETHGDPLVPDPHITPSQQMRRAIEFCLSGPAC